MTFTRRHFLSGSAGLAASCGNSSSRRPNLLLVLADDQSWPHAGAYGDPFVRTPHFDRIAREGALFTHSFTACPSCTPSRTALLTGRHVFQTGEAGVLYGTLPAGLPLLTDRLREAGYQTAFTGKGWAPGDWRAGGRTQHPLGEEFNALRHPATVPVGIDPRDYAANFNAFLTSRDRERPFFFWLGSTEPHRIYDPDWADRLGRPWQDLRVPAYLPDTDTSRRDLAAYYAEIEWFDTQLGRALAALEAAGELENTLVVVTSDNGMPFPRAKVNLYDGGTRMPLAMRWPGQIRAGQRVDALVTHTDLPATFAAAAGLPALEGAVGSNLLPGLTGETPPAQRQYILTALERHTYCRPDGATYPMRALRTPTHLYIRNFAPDRWPTGGPDFVSSNKTFHGDIDGAPIKDEMLDPANAKRFARQIELCTGKRPSEELYDIAADPDQVNNLAAMPEHLALLTGLREQLTAALREAKDPRIDGKDPWRAYPYRQTTGFGASMNTALPPDVREAARKGVAHKPE